MSFFPGKFIRILFNMVDGDTDGEDRVTPAGSIGLIEGINQSGVNRAVIFRNGATGYFSPEELNDASEVDLNVTTGPQNRRDGKVFADLIVLLDRGTDFDSAVWQATEGGREMDTNRLHAFYLEWQAT